MTTESPTRPRSVLFLCTGNSARSQIAEALMNKKARGRFAASSAGSRPATRVNPLAIQALKEIGIDWAGHEPRSIDSIIGQKFDFVITVCDNAKEACPILPGHPIHAHWGMEDPAEVEGTDAEKAHAFASARVLIGRRIDLMLALPIEKLERLTLGSRLNEIASETDSRSGRR
jgi:arsenate reductase (thioredoxin)